MHYVMQSLPLHYSIRLQVSGLIRLVSQMSGLTRQVSQVSGLTRQVSQMSGLIRQISLGKWSD